MTAYTAPQHLQSASITLFADIYRANPFSQPRLDAMRPLERGAEAARTLARCRRMLETARRELADGKPAEARSTLAIWAMARREWAQLTRQTVA